MFATSVDDPHALDQGDDTRQVFAWPHYSCLLDAQPDMLPAVGKPLPTCSGSLSFRKRRSSGIVTPDSPGRKVQVMEYDMCEFLQ